jgi:hypothetical protein
MAAGGSAPVDNLLDDAVKDIRDATVQPMDKRALKILNTFDKDKVFGTDMDAHLKIRTGWAGQIGGAKGVTGPVLPAGMASTAILGKLVARKQMIGWQFSDTDLRKMEGGRKGQHTTLAKELAGGMKKFKNSQNRFVWSRGDGVVARVNGTFTTETKITCDLPIFAIEDDEVRGYDSRHTDTAGTQSATRRVVDVDHQEGYVYLDAASVGWADEECMALYNFAYDQTSAANKFTATPRGAQAWLDNTGDDTATAIWDTGDESGARHVKTYLGLDRTAAANRKLLTTFKNASSAAVNGYWISYGVMHLQAKGINPSELILVMSHKMYNRIVDMYSGAIGPDATITLPGGKLTLPTVSGAGTNQLPVLATPYMKDGVIVTIRARGKTGDFDQVYAGGGWVGGRGNRMHLKPDGSGNHNHVWNLYYTAWWGMGCVEPHNQHVTYGLDTTDPT